MTGAAASRRLAAYIYFLVDIFTFHFTVDLTGFNMYTDYLPVLTSNPCMV